ncbi:MAG TPA: hypothetical protein VNO30_43820, partial [Kofleriaceae bacterium]|nr:hypothetical protein [Kofleriaceae bacterium]
PWSWIKGKARAAGRFARDEIAPRAMGAVKVWAGTAAFVAGAALCETGLGCVAGGPLMAMSADVGASGFGQVIDGSPHVTVAGQLGGPTAQAIEEGIVGAAGLVGTVRALPARGTSRSLPASGNETTGSGIQASVARGASQAEILAANRAAGIAAERAAARQLVAEGNTILGSQVSVRTSLGLRRIDHLIQTPGGQILAVEVKSGNAVRSAAQLAKDAALASEGGVLVGRNARRHSKDSI